MEAFLRVEMHSVVMHDWINVYVVLDIAQMLALLSSLGIFFLMLVVYL